MLRQRRAGATRAVALALPVIDIVQLICRRGLINGCCYANYPALRSANLEVDSFVI